MFTYHNPEIYESVNNPEIYESVRLKESVGPFEYTFVNILLVCLPFEENILMNLTISSLMLHTIIIHYEFPVNARKILWKSIPPRGSVQSRERLTSDAHTGSWRNKLVK